MTSMVEPATPLPSGGARRRPVMLLVVAAMLAALAFGLALPLAPTTAIMLLVLVPLVLLAPVAALAVLVGVAVLVPFGLQDSFAIVGGRGTPGLLLIDGVLLLGLCRVAWLVQRRRLTLDKPMVIAAVVAFLCTAALALGILQGASISAAGHEARRVVLAAGTFLLAWPIVKDPVARRKLGPILLAIGLALGVWGLAQWLLGTSYTTSAADVGVRPGVDLTSTGRGQLQGGLFAYPVAVTLAWTALICGAARSTAMRATLAAVLVINGCCLLLTYERTFWAVTALGCVLAAVWSGATARGRALRWAALCTGGIATLAVLAPGEIITAVERLLSIGQLEDDNSYSYRVIESQAVIDAITQRPVIGSGFGAAITWGEDSQFAAQTTPFTHNGFLWLTWRFGIPVALFVFGVVVWAVLRRPPAGDAWPWRILRIASRAAIVGVVLVNITFPAVNALKITALLGLLLAICISPPDHDLASSPPRSERPT
jgi:hypothetical protein